MLSLAKNIQGTLKWEIILRLCHFNAPFLFLNLDIVSYYIFYVCKGDITLAQHKEAKHKSSQQH